MFQVGDIISVKEKGHRAKITKIDDRKVWVVWESFPNREIDYPKHEAFPYWEKAFEGPIQIKTCRHIWAEYVGVTHKYFYCKKCNIKKS